jgi:hypothetical protein
LRACHGRRIQHCTLDDSYKSKEAYQQAPTGSTYAQMLAMADQSCSILLLFDLLISLRIKFRPELKCNSEGVGQTFSTMNFICFLKSNASIAKYWLVFVV